MIEAAEQWHYGRELAIKKEEILFIQFVIEKVSATQLYSQVFKNC
ncbi:hypothetical protein [Candidatus Amoebophilus asiaticus]|nr:hypothetical protein [Candidatus Amoebophilus asiaticus]